MNLLVLQACTGATARLDIARQIHSASNGTFTVIDSVAGISRQPRLQASGKPRPAIPGAVNVHS